MNDSSIENSPEWEKSFKELTDFFDNYWDGTIEGITNFPNNLPNYISAGTATLAKNLGKVFEHANAFATTDEGARER